MESPCISPPQFVLEAGENFSLKPWASSFHPSAQRLSTVQLRMKSSLQTGVCLSAFRSKHVAQFWPYLVHACATCLCWPLKDDLPPLCDFFFFCRCFILDVLPKTSCPAIRISLREDTKKAQQLFVIVQLFVCLMLSWKYYEPMIPSEVQRQNRTHGTKPTSFSAAP